MLLCCKPGGSRRTVDIRNTGLIFTDKDDYAMDSPATRVI